MLKNITVLISLSWLCQPLLHAAPLASAAEQEQVISLLNKYGYGFANLEHRFLGDEIRIQHPGQGVRQGEKIQLPNGLALSYGEIVMFAGDFIGDVGYPISSCKLNDRDFCFHKQFAALAEKPLGKNSDAKSLGRKISNINHYLSQLYDKIDAANRSGIRSKDYYKAHGADIGKQLNIATGGGSSLSAYLPFGDYINMATVNFDHFQPDAQKAYAAGHHSALTTAIQAKQAWDQGLKEEAESLLMLAYAQNAYANHFLSDAFSSGHLRNPRRAFDKQVLLPGVLNLLLANLMHDEDNEQSFLVTNQLGEAWNSCGDGYLSEMECQEQRQRIINAMQDSADAVYTAFLTGEYPASYAELKQLPDVKLSDLDSQSSPLFKVVNHVLLKRKSDHNIQDYHWTDLWSGLLTLIKFKM